MVLDRCVPDPRGALVARRARLRRGRALKNGTYTRGRLAMSFHKSVPTIRTALKNANRWILRWASCRARCREHVARGQRRLRSPV